MKPHHSQWREMPLHNGKQIAVSAGNQPASARQEYKTHTATGFRRCEFALARDTRGQQYLYAWCDRNNKQLEFSSDISHISREQQRKLEALEETQKQVKHGEITVLDETAAASRPFRPIQCQDQRVQLNWLVMSDATLACSFSQ